MELTQKTDELLFLSGGGEMGEMIRATDWSKTPLGHPATWPQCLRTMVSVLLDNPFPMYIAWGKEYIQIYNDAYRPILGANKHPSALGSSTKDTFSELWEMVEPMFSAVLKGEAFRFPDLLMPMNRNGFTEDCYFDFAYSPIRNENNSVGGILVTLQETTTRKKTELDLQESEARFKNMADNIPNLAWMAKADGWLYWYNKKWYDYTGTGPQDMEGWGWQSVHDPAELPRVLEEWTDSIAKGHPFELTFPLRGADGKYRQFLTRALPVKDAEGKIINWFGTNTDITLQKETEQALIESNNELEFVLEAAQLGTFDYSPLTGKFSANDRLKEWFGLPPEDKIELGQAIAAIAEKDRLKVSAAILESLKYSSGGIYNIEYTIVNPQTGKETIVHAKGRAWFDDDKNAYRLTGTLEDITEQTLQRRKTTQIEENIRNMVLEAPIGICLLDASTLNCEISNESFLTIANKKNDEIVGKYYWEVFPDLKKRYQHSLEKVVKDGLPFYANEVSLKIKKGENEELIYVTFVFSPIKDDDNKAIKVAVWVLENTPQVLARKKIAESEANLRMMILQAPIAIGIMRGPDYRIEIANDRALALWARTREQVQDKPIFDSMPELLSQGIKVLVDNVWNTGERFAASELPVQILRDNELQTTYFNFSYEVLRDADGTVNGIMAIGIDVTEQVLARKKIEEAEQKARLAINSAELGYYDIEYESDQMLTDKRFKEIWGVDEEVSRDVYASLIHPEDQAQRKAAHEEALRTGQLEYQARILWRGNNIRWVRITGSLSYKEDKKPFKLIGVIQDITDAVLSRKQLQEKEQRFSDLIQQAPMAACVMRGKDFIVEIANEKLLELWGRNQEDFLGKPVFEAIPEVARMGFEELLTEVYQSGKPYFESEQALNIFRNGNLEEVYVNFVYHPLYNTKKEIDGVIAMATEVTDQVLAKRKIEEVVRKRTLELHLANESLKKSEQRYHLMVEEVQDYSIIYLDAKGTVENWNQGAQKIKGYYADEIIGRNISVFYTELDRNTDLPKILLEKATKTGRAMQEGWRVKKDGTLFWANVVITALHNEQGEVIGFSKVTHDLTEKKAANDLLKVNAAELEQKNIELEKMNKELQSFAYISSHDLQEPLRKIQTFATQIIEKEGQVISMQGKEKLLRMQSAAERMQTLIDDLLAYSRTNSADRKFELVDLNKLINEVKEDLKEELAYENVDVEITGQNQIKVIPFQFKQLLVNLLGNAIKFRVEGRTPHILISSELKSGYQLQHNALVGARNYYHISVADNGIGFEQEFSEKIFQVFQRLHGKEKYQGTGIGLAIVKKIVENHHGIISARGEVNKGATFDIYLPVY